MWRGRPRPRLSISHGTIWVGHLCPTFCFWELPLNQTDVRRNAHPPAILIHPGVRKAAVVLEGLALVRPLGLIRADHDGGIVIWENLLIFINHGRAR